jgi:hypothetical protein
MSYGATITQGLPHSTAKPFFSSSAAMSASLSTGSTHLKQPSAAGVDEQGKRFSKELIFLGDTHTVQCHRTPVILFHYAIRNWNLNSHGSWMVCGHSHGNDAYIHPDTGRGRIIDVSMEAIGARPLLSANLSASWISVRPTVTTITRQVARATAKNGRYS